MTRTTFKLSGNNFTFHYVEDDEDGFFENNGKGEIDNQKAIINMSWDNVEESDGTTCEESYESTGKIILM